MRVPRIFVDETLAPSNRVPLDSHNSHYLRNVLRLESGQELILFNGRDNLAYPALLQVKGKDVSALTTSCIEGQCDPTTEIQLIQALGRGDAIDIVVQKATEMGATSIQFFNAEHTQTPLKSSRLDKKLSHWRSIAIAACAQCHRNQVPEIGFHPSLPTCLEQLTGSNTLFLDFAGGDVARAVSTFQPETPISIMVGPEGGFNDDEVATIRASGASACKLGPRVLRMETAALSALALVQHYMGDM